MNRLTQAEAVAVFDVDETLIPFKSMFVFLEYAMKAKLGPSAGGRSYRVFRAEIDMYRTTHSREEVNRLFYRVFKGWPLADLESLARRWWAELPAKDRWIPDVLDVLKAHQSKGHPIILLSGSAKFILAPLATELGTDLTLATNLSVSEAGICDGEILGIQTIGAGKRAALAQIEVLAEMDAQLIGYGDHASDLGFLDYCDEAHVVLATGAPFPNWAKGLKPLRTRPGFDPAGTKPALAVLN